MLQWALLGAGRYRETPHRAYLKSHSELAQTAWQTSYTNVMLHLYHKSANLEYWVKKIFFGDLSWNDSICISF